MKHEATGFWSAAGLCRCLRRLLIRAWPRRSDLITTQALRLEDGRNEGTRRPGSAGFQPAVSPISNRQSARAIQRVWEVARAAGCRLRVATAGRGKPAIRQVRNLRYSGGLTSLYHRLAKLFLRTAAAWIAAALALANSITPVAGIEPLTLRSRSGQFVVQGLSVGALPAVASPAVTNSFVRLDPAVMAVSCERVKDALLKELGLSDNWRGTIFISLRPVERHDEAIDLVSLRYRDGWNYRMTIPDQVARTRLVGALVQVLIAEMAQRRAAREETAELPGWLPEGLAAHLAAYALSGLALEPHTSTVVQGKRRDPLTAPRDLLRTNRPLTIEQLSWPTSVQLSGADGGVYRACAHFFVSELLRLENGRESLALMIEHLSDHLNWQTAFLRAFKQHFHRMVDVEKWWALANAHLTGVDTMSLWTPEQTLAQLDEALITEMQSRQHTNDLPRTERLTLQQVLTDVGSPRREVMVEAKVKLLNAVKLRAAPGLVRMVEGYQTALLEYARAPRTSYSAKEPPKTIRKRLSPDTITLLGDLDAHRETLRRQLRMTLTEVRGTE